MRIAYLTNCYPRTSHTFIRREIEAVEALGVDVRRYSLRPPDEELVNPADRLELARTRLVLAEGVPRHALALVAASLFHPIRFWRAAALAVKLGQGSDRGVLRHLVYLAEAAILRRWLRQEGVEHLHAHFGTNSATVALLCQALGGPTYSFTVHGSELEHAEDLKLAEKIHHSAFTVAVSAFGRAQLGRWAREEDGDRIRVVRCGLDEDFLSSPPTPVPDSARLACVARLIELKGHAVLLAAARRLARWGLRFEIVLVGDGPLRGRIEELVREYGLRDRVKLAGWLATPEVVEVIRHSRAVVLPSLSEGLPVVLMEALALGRPVVASAIAGVPELVEPGVTGWLVPAGSEEALALALRSVLEAPRTRLDSMGQSGAAAVRRLHDGRREARRLVALFSEAVGRLALQEPGAGPETTSLSGSETIDGAGADPPGTPQGISA